MTALVEVAVLAPGDATAAETGGADRVLVLGSTDDGGMSPALDVLTAVRAATSLPMRCMLRLRPGYGTDGGEFTRLRGLAASYLDHGADGLMFGFLNGFDEVDTEVASALLADGDAPWTFHRAVDAAVDADDAWRAIARLPRVDAVLTAGSARGVEQGLDALVARARRSPGDAELMLAGGGLLAEHVPWLARAGVRQFHLGREAREGGWESPVSVDRVRSWRLLIDQETAARRAG